MRLTPLLLVLMLAACASREPELPLSSYQTVPAPGVAETATASDFRISPLDVLRIDVFGEPQLSFEELPVGVDGTIDMPLVGTVNAEGLTPAQLSSSLSSALNRYLRDPKVAVNVATFNSQKVTVTGAVKTPGVYQAVRGMGLLDAVALGEGVSDVAKLDEVIVFRRQDGQRYVARFDMGAIQAGRAPDPAVQPGDIVVVGYSNSRRFFRDAVAILPAAAGVFLTLIPRL